MLLYDGTSFEAARKIDVLFKGMEQEKERWMKDYSILVDCILGAYFHNFVWVEE